MNFNEWTNTLLYKKYITHTLFSKGVMVVVCERWVGDRDRLQYWPPSSSSTIAALLSHLGWGCWTVGHWGPKALCLQLVLTSASCLQLTRTAPAPGYTIFKRSPASAVLPLIFTGESLDWRLGRGSIYNNLRRLDVTDIPVKDYQLMLVWKLLRCRIKNTDNN